MPDFLCSQVSMCCQLLKLCECDTLKEKFSLHACVCCRRQLKFSCRSSQHKHRSSSPSATQETWLAHCCMSRLVYNIFICLEVTIKVLSCTPVGEKSSAASETTELCRRLEKKICNLNSLGSKLKMENQGMVIIIACVTLSEIL